MTHYQDTKSTKGSARKAALVSLLSWWLILFLPAAVQAVTVDPQLADPKLEARAKDISRELRCLVCQNQSIEDSGAPLARDLRIIVRERIVAGDSDSQVKSYVVARYGDWVLLRPPFNARTLLLWIGPVVLLVTAVAGLALYYRRTRKQFAAATVAPLSGEEKRRLAELLKGNGA